MTSRIAIILCLLLAGIFGVTSYRAAITKGPTIDEPLHFVSAYARVFLHDERLDPENPMLWKQWMMLPIVRGDLSIDSNDPAWRQIGLLNPPNGWFVPRLLVRDITKTRRLINRSRLMMTLLGVALCLIAAGWAHRLGGPWAAIAAAVVISFDPNFLAHAPILKNDVALSMAMLAAMMFTCRAGVRLTVLTALATAIACAVAVNCKFSGFIVPLLVSALLVTRALLTKPWPVIGREIHSRFVKLVAACSTVLLIAVTLWVITWWSYGFRYAASDDPSLAFESAVPGATISDRTMNFAMRHHLLPQSYCTGFLRLHGSFAGRRTYLLGSVVDHGIWYYFPFALLVKSPLATLLAAVIALLAIWRLRKGSERVLDLWPFLCLLVPPLIYLAAAMSSDLNIGVRHVLPALAMIDVAIGVVTARCMRIWPRWTASIAAVLAVGLLIESFAAYPNYIPFFNTAAGGSRGGLNLLGDSNLDWGQDLPLLRQWKINHPDTPLYVAYFGAFDPQAAGLQCMNLPSGFELGGTTALPDPNHPCVLAVSASILQGIYTLPPWDAMYSEIRTWKPREVLGGTIYLYDFPPR